MGEGQLQILSEGDACAPSFPNMVDKRHPSYGVRPQCSYLVPHQSLVPLVSIIYASWLLAKFVLIKILPDISADTDKVEDVSVRYSFLLVSSFLDANALSRSRDASVMPRVDLSLPALVPLSMSAKG